MTAILSRFILTVSIIIAATLPVAWSAPTCPLSYGEIDSAKSNKLYLYFPTTPDAAFPNHPLPTVTNYTPAQPFDVANLTPISRITTTDALRQRIYDVVADDYCEFNVQVVLTTTNPASSLCAPPARCAIVAVGSDSNATIWGQADVARDDGDNVPVNYARVWAGTYVSCEGGQGLSGVCSSDGALIGDHATLDRWAQAIGGTAAHEAGHTYGLDHEDENPCGYVQESKTCTSVPDPNLENLIRHLMPSGRFIPGNARAEFRRYFSDITYSLLATNVGLSVQTMHNWDLQNPNSDEARSLTIEFLSIQPAISDPSWSFTGVSSPWINPSVSRLEGTTRFRGIDYNRYVITWSEGNPLWTTSEPGTLPGGSRFHIGATFVGVDFNQPDPIIIQNVTLFGDAGASTPLTLSPRLPMYDAGTLNLASGSFSVNFFPPPTGRDLVMEDVVIYQLPRVASIESMIGDGRPVSYDNVPIIPLSASKCEESSQHKTKPCNIANVSDEPHVLVAHKLGEKGVYDCSKGVPIIRPSKEHADYQNSVKQHGLGDSQDSTYSPDFEGPICAGTTRDPFPSTTVYVIATFADPDVKHYDSEKGEYVIGPMTSKVYYQFAGIRDLKKIGKTKTTIKDDNDPTSVGEKVTFTATVTRTATTIENKPTGTVQFILDGVKTGDPVKLNSNGQAEWSTANLQVGKHSVSASYVPNPGSPFLASSSPNEGHSVLKTIDWIFWLIVFVVVILILLIVWRFRR